MKIEIHRDSETTPWTYADLDLRQKQILEEVSAGGEGCLVFSEVAPVVTLGYRRTVGDLLLSREELSTRGISVLEVHRGGRATSHGPGQWVVFMIDRLERLTGDRKGVRRFIEKLSGAALEVCLEFFPLAEIREGAEAGVWTENGARGAKLAAFGVQITNGITQHGISLNVFPTPSSFYGIRPCGLELPVGFLHAEVNGNEQASFTLVRSRLEAAILKAFQ
ncbi:MAG: hypothetical protein H7301_03205 [Cryobacterium sp.]|nr:hypothetical protein [Oligoflexia bacterium]